MSILIYIPFDFPGKPGPEVPEGEPHMPTYEVKLSKRSARLALNNRACKIYIEKACSEFITEPGIFKHDGEDSVRVSKEQIIVPLSDITSIEMPVSRFTPDKMCWMKIDHNN